MNESSWKSAQTSVRNLFLEYGFSIREEVRLGNGRADIVAERHGTRYIHKFVIEVKNLDTLTFSIEQKAIDQVSKYLFALIEKSKHPKNKDMYFIGLVVPTNDCYYSYRRVSIPKPPDYIDAHLRTKWTDRVRIYISTSSHLLKVLYLLGFQGIQEAQID